ncbi:MAG: hypothetical protein KDA58_00160 [Planctomycetaceae bacterium]|nr:hypothetical protein [Planctomycetaceae bacterium]
MSCEATVTTAKATPAGQSRGICWMIGLAVIVRLLASLNWPDNMSRDLDAYLGLARSLFDGAGFCTPGTNQPTAFRPPLYPLLLALTLPLQVMGRQLLHAALGGLSILWLDRSARALGLSTRSRLVAALLLACDPLLVWYSTFPMTESLCTTLSAWLLARVTTQADRPASSPAWTGAVFGLCVLARPTYWAYGGLLGLWVFWQQMSSTNQWQNFARRCLWALLGLALVVVPWVVRNAIVFGRPVLMTTHGGYTLLLANNPRFYSEVVQQPWGTTWQGASLAEWTEELEQEMRQAGVAGELARDRWHGARAKKFIAEHPGEFAQASWHRIRMFWNIVPSGEAAAPFPRLVLLLVGLLYASYWLASLLGLSRVMWSPHWSHWMPIVLLVVAFTCVHALYWSNMRLRAPALPATAMLAGAALMSVTQKVGKLEKP